MPWQGTYRNTGLRGNTYSHFQKKENEIVNISLLNIDWELLVQSIHRLGYGLKAGKYMESWGQLWKSYTSREESEERFFEGENQRRYSLKMIVEEMKEIEGKNEKLKRNEREKTAPIFSFLSSHS